MKKLYKILLLLIVVVTGCSKTEDDILRLSCNGEMVYFEQDRLDWKPVRTEPYTREFTFVNKKLHPYECSWTNREISCLSDPQVKDSYSVLIKIDREKGESFQETIMQIDNGIRTSEIFKGKCKKLDKQF